MATYSGFDQIRKFLIVCASGLLLAGLVVDLNVVAQPNITPTSSPSLTPTADMMAEMTRMYAQITELETQVETVDMISASAPILAAVIGSIVGAALVAIIEGRRRQRELVVTRAQTIQAFMQDFRSNDAKAIEAAILSIYALVDQKLAVQIASVYANDGALLALSKMVTDRQGPPITEKELDLLKPGLTRMMADKDRGHATDGLDAIARLGWLTNGTLNNALLNGANLTETDMSRADLIDASLVDAKLSGTKLFKAKLKSANFHQADLRGADLTGASLLNANFWDQHGNLSAVFDESTRLPDSSLWTQQTDIRRFTDEQHPDYWQSQTVSGNN